MRRVARIVLPFCVLIALTELLPARLACNRRPVRPSSGMGTYKTDRVNGTLGW